jgi:hypothetical protein
LFLFLVSCRSRTCRFLCLIFNLLFLSMSFLEMFIYSYDGVSLPILSMPSLSMILVQGSDLIKSMKWRLVFLILSYFLFVSFIYCLLLRVKVWVHGHGFKARGTYQESQSDTFTGSTRLIPVRFLASKYEKRFYLPAWSSWHTNKQHSLARLLFTLNPGPVGRSMLCDFI